MALYAGSLRPDALLQRLLRSSPDDWVDRTVFIRQLKKLDGEHYANATRRDWKLILRRLKEHKLIVDRKRSNKIMIRITDDGRMRALRKELNSRKDHYPVGKGCVVLYDVPETQRSARDMIRSFLIECGFRMFQQSVWVCRKDVAAIVARFVRRNKLIPWVQVIEARILT